MRLLALTALLVGCDGDNPTGPGETDEQVDPFDSVTPTGVLDCFTPASDWGSTAWLSQQLDPGLVLPITVNALVEDFQNETAVKDATVDMWADDVVDGIPDATATSDSGGNLAIDGTSCQKSAYRVTTDPTFAETKTTYKAHNIFTAPATGSTVDDATFVSVSSITYQLIPTILGVTVDPDKAIIAGTAYDCARDPATDKDIDTGKIEGVQVVVYDASGNVSDTAQVNYFTENFPDRDQLWTSADGLWVASNVPAGNLRVEMYGNLDGVRTLLGATELLSEADSINIGNIFAGYGDGVKYPYACEDT